MSNFINPQSECILLNVAIENDYKNQYTFTSLAEQEAFFKSKATSKNFTKLTFIKDGQITVQGDVYSLYNANYLMFKNTGFKDKWFYAFITEINYVSENSSVINYELDVFQSWYFDINYDSSFIVRKHVTDDTIGANTIEENLGYGDYIFKNIQPLLAVSQWYYFMLISEDLATDKPYSLKYDNIFAGCVIYVFDNPDDVTTVIDSYVDKAKLDAIIDIYCVPDFAFNPDDVVGGYYKTDSHASSQNASYDFTNDTGLNGYTPKNNKLYCYPYNVIELTNNNGAAAVFKPELFKEYGSCKFNVVSSIANKVSSTCFPINYQVKQGEEDMDINERYFSLDLGIAIDNYPHCIWTSDFYKNWYAQNYFNNNLNLGLGIGGGLLNIGVGLATGNPVAGVIGLGSIASSIAQVMGSQVKADITPNQAKGTMSNINPLTANNAVGFYINHKTIKAEYAKAIDNYFEMFGYKVNTLEVPELRTRRYWNYIETKEINLHGDIPQNHLIKIKNMFNTGVTLWHDSDVGNYNRDNTIR